MIEMMQVLRRYEFAEELPDQFAKKLDKFSWIEICIDDQGFVASAYVYVMNWRCHLPGLLGANSVRLGEALNLMLGEPKEW